MTTKNKLAWLFSKKRGPVNSIIIQFTETPDGKVLTNIDFDKRIPVGYALDALNRANKEIGAGLAKRMAAINALGGKVINQRGFIGMQKMGDIL